MNELIYLLIVFYCLKFAGSIENILAQLINRRYLKIHCNTKFEILLVKIFSLKQKLNQVLPATKEKIKFCLVKKTVSRSVRL